MYDTEITTLSLGRCSLSLELNKLLRSQEGIANIAEHMYIEIMLCCNFQMPQYT